MKRCLFHIPYKLDRNAKAAPMLRPLKMIEAFQNIGYEVDIVSGYAAERAKSIESIKKKIESGIQYDFMYAESSTMPTLLTEKHHFPTHPFLDFDFFKFAKKHNINIGLFYRDIYWKFPEYKNSLGWLKSYIGILNYKYDIQCYKKYLTKLYVPSKRVYKYLDEITTDILDTLPPGAEINGDYEGKNVTSDDVLKVFYVGGLGNQYQIKELIKAVKETPKCEAIICCRKEEYEKEKYNLADALADNVRIIHAYGDELKEYYSWADICSLMFKPDIYRDMAIPYKTFEYLSYLKPMMASKGTAIGDFVEQNSIGWNIDYDSVAIQNLLSEIIKNPNLLEEKINSCIIVRENNTWERRAQKVVSDLYHG